MKRFLLFIIAIIFSYNCFSQSGEPIVKIYTNFHSSFYDGEVHNAFQIQRAYFGYGYDFNDNFSGKILLDVGDPGFGKLQMTAYLKNAYGQYKNDKVLVKFGMIGLHQFKMQEDLWKGRYFQKSFMDEYKFGPSADLGVYVKYNIHDFLSIDGTISNGEGYKIIEIDSIFKYAVGMTVHPFEGMSLRVYGDVMGEQSTIALYAGYKDKNLSIGGEYNRQLNHRNNPLIDLGGISVYSSYKIKKFRPFIRYDHLTSDIGGQKVISGIEYNVIKGINITPNYQYWISNQDIVIQTIYLSLEFKI